MNLDLKWMSDLNGFRNVNSRFVKLLTSNYSRAPFSSVLHVPIDNTLESNTDHSSIAFN